MKTRKNPKSVNLKKCFIGCTEKCKLFTYTYTYVHILGVFYATTPGRPDNCPSAPIAEVKNNHFILPPNELPGQVKQTNPTSRFLAVH
jgi:hypothetical protein